MLRAGLDTMLGGDSGAVTYLWLAALGSLLCAARVWGAGAPAGWDRRRTFCGGLGFLVVSRFLYLLSLRGSSPVLVLLSFALAPAGLYSIFASIGAAAKRSVAAGTGRIMVTAGVAAGIAGSVGWAVLGPSRFAGGGFVPLATCFLTCAAAGIALASFPFGRGNRSNGRSVLLCAGFCFAVASLLAGCMALGIVGADPFWRRFFFMTDLAGFVSLCAVSIFAVAPAAGARSSAADRWGAAAYADDAVSEETAAHAGDTPGGGSVFPGAAGHGPSGACMRRVNELAGTIIDGLPANDVYGAIASALVRDAGAEYALLRVAGAGDDYFKVVARTGDGGADDAPRSSFSVTRDRFEMICREDRSCGGGYLLGWEDLGGDHGSFVGSPVAWVGRSVYVAPLVERSAVRGFFVIGFFDADPTAIPSETFSLYANLALQLFQRERGREALFEKERSLAACREDLEGVNQLKSNFISIVSHELRTPLTSVKAYTETLLDNIEGVERGTMRDFLRVMDEESERLISLVDNILNYSCMETGLLKVEKTSCNLNEMIAEAVERLQPDFLDNRVNCDLKLPRHSVLVDADRELIHQLLQNLLGNAVKFTPPGGRVTVTLEEEAAAVRIVVQDTGRGIPEDQLEKIFERFHQADTSNTREFGGSGLGLAICKNIVEWHDGQIWVENVKDAGARFIVLLPMKNIVVRQAATAGFISSVRFERERYLTLLVETLSEILQARKASIMLLEENQRVLRILAAKGLDREFVEHTSLEVGDRFAGRVAETGEPLCVFDIERDVTLGRANNTMFYGTHSFICVPLKDGSKVVGVVNVSDHVEGREFTEVDRELLETLAVVITAMLKKLEAFEKVSSNFENLKEAMRRILEIRETWGSANLTNLTLLALEVGRRLDLDEKSLAALRLGMNLYDLGMMKVPRSIRGKREELTAKEWRVLRAHPDAGYTLVSPMGLEERIMRMVRSHHENFDGSGYPDGLAGAEIPIEARIVNVIDTFRALITPGPYRRCYSIDEARNEIIRGSGTKFDPKVTGAFVKVLHALGAAEDRGELVLTTVERDIEQRRSRGTPGRTHDEEHAKQEPVKEEAP